jgi:sulfite reductase (NADPH) hemoprotein beta-component
LNRLAAENVGEERVLEILAEKLGRYARERRTGERFGDFVLRID